jgi:hypothetical protein
MSTTDSVAEPDDIAAMTYPVRCTHCRRSYDLATVEVTARYADCSVWKAPCCGTVVDDRGDTGWKSRKDYIHHDGSPLARAGRR